MSEPPLSVLMTVFNGERYLRPAIDSILSQTFFDYELLLLDDGSNDTTADILRVYAARDSRITLLHNESNQGIARSANRLLGHARGRYITRHDADDVSLPERLAKQVAYLQAQPIVGVLASEVHLIGPDGQREAQATLFNIGHEHEHIIALMLSANCMCQGSVMVRRDCLDTAGHFDESLEQSEDFDLWLRLSSITRLAKLREPLYLYRRHTDSVTQARHQRSASDQAKVFEKYVSQRFRTSTPDNVRAAAARYHLRAALANWSADDKGNARRHLGQALEWSPALLQRSEPLMPLLTDYTERYDRGGSRLIEEMFDDLLPRTHYLTHLSARLRARQHLKRVFDCAARHDYDNLTTDLWRGLRLDPSWLFNRGVRAIFVRALLAGLKGRRG